MNHRLGEKVLCGLMLVVTLAIIAFAGALVLGCTPAWLGRGKGQSAEPRESKPGRYQLAREVKQQIARAFIAGDSFEALPVVGECAFVQPHTDERISFRFGLDLCSDDIERGGRASVKLSRELIAHTCLDLSVLVAQDHSILFGSKRLANYREIGVQHVGVVAVQYPTESGTDSPKFGRVDFGIGVVGFRKLAEIGKRLSDFGLGSHAGIVAQQHEPRNPVDQGIKAGCLEVQTTLNAGADPGIPKHSQGDAQTRPAFSKPILSEVQHG